MQNKLSEYNWHIYTLIKQLLSIWSWDSFFIVLKGLVSYLRVVVYK